MKRLLLLVTMLSSFSLFAAPWDLPIKLPSKQSFVTKHTLADPNISNQWVWVDTTLGQLTVAFALDGTPERPMKATVWVRMYQRVGLGGFNWIWREFTVYMPVDGQSNGFNDTFSVPSTNQYEGDPGAGNVIFIHQDQVNLTYFGPA